jgi:hypothetical protein
MYFRRVALTTLLTWLSMLGVDFLLHGGLLARFYVQPSPFPSTSRSILPPDPCGLRLVSSPRRLVGLAHGEAKHERVAGGPFLRVDTGALVWGALVLGLLSISTASLGLLAGWWFGQTAEMAVGGMIAGSCLAGARLGRMFLVVVAILVVCVAITILLQSTGLAPTIRM